jgi:hypothetical protein
MKKIKFLFAILASMFFLFNCSDKKEKTQLSFDIKQDIECIEIPYPDLLGISMQILKNDSLLLINDFRGDSLIHVFDVKNQRLIRKLISVGNGPNEMISPLDIHIRDNNLFIFYRQAGSMHSLSTDSITNGNNRSIIKNFQVSSDVNLLYPLTDSLFISSGLFKKRYALINHSGEKVQEFGEYPAYWYKEKDIPVRARAMFHQTFFEKHPKDSLFISYSPHILEIYDYSSNIYQPVLIKSILLGKYNYSYIDDGTTLSTNKGSDVERGIFSVACSSKYIYTVYNPNVDYDGNTGTQIRVIDWSGNPVKLLQSSKSISCLVIDEEEKKGYVIAQDPDDSLMYFDINLQAD